MRLMKFHHNTFFFLIATVVILLTVTSCTQEDFISDSSTANRENLEKLYNDVRVLEKHSFFHHYGKNSRSENSISGLCIFTDEDLNYLASLDQEEFNDIRLSFMEKLGTDPESVMDSIQDSDRDYLLEILGSQEEIDKLEAFCEEYLESNGGWDDIESLIPDGLSDQQEQIYVCAAACIDDTSRPLMNVLIPIDDTIEELEEGYQIVSEHNKICREIVKYRLSLIGLNIGVDVLVDLMTGGLGISLDEIEAWAIGLELLSIWNDYEICNGRWH